MKEDEDGTIHLELADVIRVNQLVRNGTNVGEASLWFHSLSKKEQNALLSSLFFLATQAGFDDASWNEAVLATKTGDKAILDRMKTDLFSPFQIRTDRLLDWFDRLEAEHRLDVYTFALHLFSSAEGRRFRGETKESCNHWWHRDLLDERVVKDILGDPKFYMTSIADDDAIKSGSLGRRLLRFFKRKR